MSVCVCVHVCVCVTPVTKEFRKQGKDLENASRRAGGARDIASLAPAKTLAMKRDGSWDANSCTCCVFAREMARGKAKNPVKDRCVVRQKDPFSEWRPAHVCSRQLSFSALSAPGLPG